MFWLYARPGVRGLDDLVGQAIAGYPNAAPPALLSRAFLRARGAGPDAITVLPARDDAARIGLLSDGAVAAAVVSSAVAPRLLQRRGFRELAWFGDDLRVPTTGLSIPGGARESHGDVIAAMCACYREALALLHDDIGVLEAAIAGIVTTNAADQAAIANRVRRAYTRDGRCSRVTLEAGVELLATALQCPDVRAIDSLYASAMSSD
jgi:ABC-type nitrate/sulfonate/bicarbonate transport system substrate-binding protein